jgi:GAF domain-containing protein/anti-sigma regulatory factor (Ser/Thr protein kinase)
VQVADDSLHLAGQPDTVPYARRWVSEALTGTEAEMLVPDAELVVSELVTNALLHAGPPVTLRVEVTPPKVRIEVGDTSRVTPVRALARSDAMTGRGLALVAALARDWGVEPTAEGKVVWCELSTEPVEIPDDVDMDVDALLASWDDFDDEVETEARFTVELGDVPTDLLLAAKAHVDNLVREFTLATAGAESGRSAEVPPALALLIESVVSGFAEARQSIKRQALDAASRGDERTTLSLTLPLSAADAGEAYLHALDEADSYARAARLLTLETPPQHRVFRRWYVESIVARLRAEAAGLPAPTPISFERRLLDELAVVAAAHRASDRAARLQSVTAALAVTENETDVANAVVSEGVAALGASGGSLLVPSEDHLDVPAAVGYDPGLVERLRAERPDADLPAATALRTGEPVWLESRQEREERFPELVGFEPQTISMCAVPLLLAGRVIGALRFSFDMPRLFDADERRFVQTLAGQTAHALGRAQAVHALAEANDKLAFLAEASAALASSLDYKTTLRNVAHLAVPRLADWCAIHVLDEGELVPIAVTHVDPAKVAMAEDFQRRYPSDPDATTGVHEVMRTGASQLYPEITDEMLAAGVSDEEQLAAMRSLGFVSALVVPLAARSRIFGAITLVQAESGRRYGQPDLALAEDLARRAALAIDNAHLYSESAGTD